MLKHSGTIVGMRQSTENSTKAHYTQQKSFNSDNASVFLNVT